MENLHYYINQEFIKEEFEAIDREIILESLDCTVLKEVAAQLSKQFNDEKKKIDDKIAQYEKEGRYYWGDKKVKTQKFSEIFATCGYGKVIIRWDKVTDKDVTKIDAASWENFTGRNSANIRKVINSKKSAILITQNPENNQFEYVIFTGGLMICLFDIEYYKKAGDTAQNYNGRKWVNLNQKDKIDLCNGKNLYFIDTTDKGKELEELKNERREQKQGMILMDPDSLARMAQHNRDRYAKIVAKAKAMNVNNDPILDKCKTVIDKITQLSIDVAKDPIGNADLISGISALVPCICDKKRWESDGRYKGRYTGMDGLLPLISEYAQTIKYVASEGSKYYLDRIDSIKKKINDALDTINRYCQMYHVTL